MQVTAQLLTVYPTLTKDCRAGTGLYKPLVGIVTDAERFAVVILDHEILYLMNGCSHKIRSYDGVSDVAKSIQLVLPLSAKESPPPVYPPYFPDGVRCAVNHTGCTCAGASRAWTPLCAPCACQTFVGALSLELTDE